MKQQIEFLQLAPIEFGQTGVISEEQDNNRAVSDWADGVFKKMKRISPRRMKVWKLKQALKIAKANA